MDEQLTTTQAAERIGHSLRWIQALVKSGRLPAIRMGRDYIIKASDLEMVRDLKPTGRPKKATNDAPVAKKAGKKRAAKKSKEL